MSVSPGASRTGRRPRILIDAIAYAPRDGGFTTAMHDLLDTCRALPEFEFVVVHARRHRSAFRSFGLATYSVAIPGSLRFFASLFLLPIIARRAGAAAVHAEISALPWFIGVPGSVTVHDVHFLIEPQAGGRSIRQRVMGVYWGRVFVASIRRAAIVKAISATTAEDLRQRVALDLPIVVSEPRFVAPPGPEPARRFARPDEDLRLLFVGSVVPRRNLPFLLRALPLVRRRWRLDVVGSLWWGKDELEATAMDERVHIHGYLPDPERERLMADAHLLVAPSRYEGFGYPTAEAMIRGLPVFTSDIGAFREFVPEPWRFPLEDPAVLASMIDTLDADAFSTMAREAPDLVARFGVENHRANHRVLFQRLVAGASVAAGPPAVGSDWRPGKLDRVRALGRRAVSSTLGDGAERRLRGFYHGVLRKTGRFGLPEDAATASVLAAVAERAGTILDVGANVGRYAWFLRRHASPSSRLYAFEPHPAAAQLLRAAVGRSPGCTVLEVAAADRDEVAELVVPEGPFGSAVSALSWIRTEPNGDERSALTIASRRIDGLLEDGTIEVADPVFMKIDVEGAEGRVLRGAAGLVDRHRPVIYFECQNQSAVRQGETPDGLWAQLGEAGYRIFATGSGAFVPVDRVQPEVTNYLAIPGVAGSGGDQALDAAAIIAIIDGWATRGPAA